MPRRGSYSRPFFRRPSYGYGAFNQYPGGLAPGTFEAGTQFGGDIVQGINQLMEQRRMDQIANEILTKQYGVQNLPQRPGFNWWGGGNQAGGTAELAMRQAQAAIEAKAQEQALAAQLKKAQIANYIAMTQGTGRYAKPPPGQLTPAQQLAEQHRQWQEDERLRQATLAQARKEQAAATDTMPKVLKDFNTLYPGKTKDPNDPDTSLTQGEAIYNSLQQGSGARGNVVDGQFVGDPNGEYYSWYSDVHGKPASQVPKVKWDILQPFMQRVENIQKAGGQVVPPMVARALPVRGQPGPQAAPAPAPATAPAPTTQATDTSNLPSPQTQDEYEAIPTGSQFVDVDGITKTKY
jgi:hypothetical protein